MLTSVGEQGYAATVVADVIAKAVASRKTFYEHFEDKHACFFAMSEEIIDEWVARVERPEVTSGDGREVIEALVDELFTLALESPASLRVIAVELTAAGPAGIERRERALYRLAQPLREALGQESSDIDLLARTIVGAILRILYATSSTWGTRTSSTSRRLACARTGGVDLGQFLHLACERRLGDTVPPVIRSLRLQWAVAPRERCRSDRAQSSAADCHEARATCRAASSCTISASESSTPWRIWPRRRALERRRFPR